MVFPEQDQRELGNSLGLDQRKHFEKLIERAEAARHKHKANAVFYETDLPGKKIMKIDRNVGETVSSLLVWQFDIQADGFALHCVRTTVGGFHDSRTAPGNDREVVFCQPLG